MSSTNERIDDLLGAARKLCTSIDEASRNGYIADGPGQHLQLLASRVMEASRHVEYDLNADDLAAQDAVEEDEHLMASYDNDLGDVS